MSRRTVIGVVGPGEIAGRSDEDFILLADAYNVGRRIGLEGAVVFCGGLGGVMEEAARGAKSVAAWTVGILPGDKGTANPSIDFAVATGMGEARNAVLVRSCDAIIAVGGSFGTLSEIALALKMNVPVVLLKSWSLTQPDGTNLNLPTTGKPDEAVRLALEAARRNSTET